jgi:hypothetical protein
LSLHDASSLDGDESGGSRDQRTPAGFVEDEHGRVAEQDGRDAESLLHPERVGADVAVCGVGQAVLAEARSSSTFIVVDFRRRWVPGSR